MEIYVGKCFDLEVIQLPANKLKNSISIFLDKIDKLMQIISSIHYKSYQVHLGIKEYN